MHCQRIEAQTGIKRPYNIVPLKANIIKCIFQLLLVGIPLHRLIYFTSNPYNDSNKYSNCRFYY